MPRFVTSSTAAVQRTLAETELLRVKFELSRQLAEDPAEAVRRLRGYLHGERIFNGMVLARSLAGRAADGDDQWGRELDQITSELVEGVVQLSARHEDWPVIGEHWPGLPRVMWANVTTPAGTALRAGLSVWLPAIELEPVPPWLLAYLRDDEANPDRWAGAGPLGELEPESERRARKRATRRFFRSRPAD